MAATRTQLLSVPDGIFLVGLLQDEEDLFLVSILGDESLAIVIVLYSRQQPQWRAEVHQQPRAHSPQLRNLIQHDELMFVNIGLKFFCPPGGDITMQAGLCAAAKFAHDERLLIANVPLGVISVGGRMFVPANVLIGSQHVQDITKWVVDNFGVALGAAPAKPP